MASFSISASLAGAYSPIARLPQTPNRQKLQATRNQSASTKVKKQEVSNLKSDETEVSVSVPKFSDERWRNGTWDLNMFVKDGTMDWDGVIVAEAKRRRFLEVFPAACTEQEPVLFRSSVVPWWAWLWRSYLPQAELLNGRAAMIGFFMSYFVDTLTGLDVVGQSGNFICKAGLFVTVVGTVLFRRTQDFQHLRQLSDEAISYDKQWQASWNDPK